MSGTESNLCEFGGGGGWYSAGGPTNKRGNHKLEGIVVVAPYKPL